MNFFIWLPVAYFGSLWVVALISSVWLLGTTRRLPIAELADSPHCLFWKEIQYDMGRLNQLLFRFLGAPITPRVQAETARMEQRVFLDIGSGNGVSSLLYLRALFGAETTIFLSDIQPNLEAWKTLTMHDPRVLSISESVDGNNLSSFLTQHPEMRGNNISLLNSLHHLSEETVANIFRHCSEAGVGLFIMDARRLTFIHPLFVPFGYFFLYVVLAASGSSQQFHPYNFPRRIVQILIEAWIMSIDQLLGAARRYDLSFLMKCAKKNRLSFIHDHDTLMNYLLLVPIRPEGSVPPFTRVVSSESSRQMLYT